MANFTPEEISEILAQFFDVVGKRQYIGARYVPIFGRKNESSIEWDNTKPYEPLTIVLYQGNSFTSRQYVPEGVAITDNDYWANTGNYNAQVEQYRRDVANLADELSALKGIIPDSDFSSSNTVKDYIDDVETSLSDAIDLLETNVGDDIDQLSTELNGKIDTVKDNLSDLYIKDASMIYTYTNVEGTRHRVHIGTCDMYDNYKEITSFTEYVNSEELDIYPSAVTYMYEHNGRFFMQRGFSVAYSDDLVNWYVTEPYDAIDSPYGLNTWACKVFKISDRYYYVGSYRYDSSEVPTRDGGTTYNFKQMWCEVTFDSDNMPVFGTLTNFPYFSGSGESWIDLSLCYYNGTIIAACKNELNGTIQYIYGSSFLNMTPYTYQIVKSGVEAPCLVASENGVYLTFEEYSGSASQYTGFSKAVGHVLFGKCIYNSGGFFNPQMNTLKAPHPFVHIQFVNITDSMLKALKNVSMTNVIASRFDRGFDSVVVNPVIKTDTDDKNYVLELTEGHTYVCGGSNIPTHFTLEVYAPYNNSETFCGVFSNGAATNKYVTLTGDVYNSQKNVEFTLAGGASLLFRNNSGHNAFVSVIQPALLN